MVSKICLNMKLTPPCIPLPQCNKTLGKDKVTCGFYILHVKFTFHILHVKKCQIFFIFTDFTSIKINN